MARFAASRNAFFVMVFAALLSAASCSRPEGPKTQTDRRSGGEQEPIAQAALAAPGEESQPPGAIESSPAPPMPGGKTPNAAKASCTPEDLNCVAIESECPNAIQGCVVAQLDLAFPPGFLERTPVRRGLALAERHPRWRGAKDDTIGAEAAWRRWSASGTQKGPYWTSVTLNLDLSLKGGKPAARSASFFTDVAFHPLAPVFGWSRVALIGWSKARRPILLTDHGPAELYSSDVLIAGRDAYIVIDKARAKVVARLAAPRIFRDGRFAFINRREIYYWSREGEQPRCVKAFGPALGLIKAGPRDCGGVAATPDDGDYGLAQSDARDVAIMRRTIPDTMALADKVGCGSDAAGRVYRVAEDPTILVYASQIICD